MSGAENQSAMPVNQPAKTWSAPASRAVTTTSTGRASSAPVSASEPLPPFFIPPRARKGLSQFVKAARKKRPTASPAQAADSSAAADLPESEKNASTEPQKMRMKFTALTSPQPPSTQNTVSSPTPMARPMLYLFQRARFPRNSSTKAHSAAVNTAAPSAGPGLLLNRRFDRPSSVNTFRHSMPRQSAAGSIRHSRTPNTGFGLSSMLSIAALLGELQNVPGLAAQRAAERVECGKTHGFRLAGFEHGEICQGYADPVRELREAHLAPGEHDVEIYPYHGGHLRS